VGISHILGDRHSQENSFGLVALCSIGPILAVMMLGIFADNNFFMALHLTESFCHKTCRLIISHICKFCYSFFKKRLFFIELYILYFHQYIMKFFRHYTKSFNLSVIITIWNFLCFYTNKNEGFPH